MMLTTATVTGRHARSATDDLQVLGALALHYVVFAARWLAGLERNATTGRHAQRGARAVGWLELVVHYVAATLTWTHEINDEGDPQDNSALERGTRFTLTALAMVGVTAAFWFLGRSA